MSKRFRITVDKTRWEATSAELLLGDPGGGYHNPMIVLDFARCDEQSEGERSTVAVVFSFQRHALPSQYGDDVPARFPLDTARRWSQCYAERVVLSEDANRFPLRDAPHELRSVDRLRIAVGRQVARAVRTYNLHRVTEDPCDQVLRALDDYLHCPVKWLYVLSSGVKLERWQCREQGIELDANDCHRLHERERLRLVAVESEVA